MITTHTFVSDGITPVRAYAALRQASGGAASFLLESVVGGERWGRYSILGYKPRYEATLTAKGWSLRGERGPLPDAPFTNDADPLRAAANLFGRHADGGGKTPAERFARAHVGFFAWDVVHAIDRVKGFEGTADAPLARFVGGATIIIFDGLAQTVTIAAESPDDVAQARADLERKVTLSSLSLPDRSRIPARVDVSMDDAAFEANVRRAQEYIAAGDAFQVVLGRKFQTPGEGRDPFDVYRAMRVINPSPYMYFLDFPPAPDEKSRTQIAGASPETLVRLEDSVMTVRPLAGTRPRGRTLEEDAAQEEELLADPKELAEHVMLIDLGRNDVGRVANVGSVELPRRMEIERYSHVMHIVSEVRGRIDASVPPLEVFRAAFPAGTLSGAPKLRAMQIIRELEGTPRGLYGGAIGYVAPTGDLDFAIAIRTAVFKDDVFTVTAGAGIVEASIPSSECEETRNKAHGVLCAIEAAPKRG